MATANIHILTTATIDRNNPDHRDINLAAEALEIVASIDGIAETWFIRTPVGLDSPYGPFSVTVWQHGPLSPGSANLWTFPTYSDAIAAIANTIRQAQQQNGYHGGPELATIHPTDPIAPADPDTIEIWGGPTRQWNWTGDDGWDYTARLTYGTGDEEPVCLTVRSFEPQPNDRSWLEWTLPADTNVLELMLIGDNTHTAEHIDN